nr:MAG: internal head protein [Bacteriophage sp.]
MAGSKLLRIPTRVKRTNVSLEEREPAADRDPDIVDMSQTPDDVNPDEAGTTAAASSEATSQDSDAGVASTEATGDVATGAEPDAAASASAAADVGATTSAEATPPADDSTVDSGSDAANADLDNQGDITPPEEAQSTDSGLGGDASTDTGADAGQAATEPSTPVEEANPVENPADDIPEEALTSAWVQGVAVDNHDDVTDLKEGEEELDSYQHNEDELHDVATSLEELRNCCVPVSVGTHTETDDLSTPVQTEVVSDISDKAVDLLTSTANQALSRLDSQLDLPATTESAGTPAERLQITLEAIDGKLKQIWEAIKKLVVAAWEAFTNFVKGIFDKAQRIRNQVAGLRKFVTRFKGATPKETEFENNAVWAGCSTDDKNGFDSAKISPLFETYLSAAKPYLLNASKALAPGLSLVFDRVAAIDPEKAETRQAMWDAFANLMGRYSKSVVMVTKMVGGDTKLDDSDLAGFGPTPGLRSIYSNAGLGGGYLTVDIIDSSVKVDIAAPAFWNHASSRYVRGHVVVPENAKVPTLSADQMEAMLDQIDEAMETVLEYRSTFKTFEQQLAKGQQATTKLASKIPENASRNDANVAIFASMKLVPKLTGFNQAVINGLYIQSSSMLQYIVASTKQYSTNESAIDSTAQAVADEGAAKLPAPKAA